jgi:outer membrane protein
MNPVQNNISKAIEEVAKENGYSFIFNPDIRGVDSILYADEKMNVSDLVLNKLTVEKKPDSAPRTVR